MNPAESIRGEGCNNPTDSPAPRMPEKGQKRPCERVKCFGRVVYHFGN